MNVLIIDDERAIRRALKEILEFEDCAVQEAEDGKQGLALSQEKEFDLIFCDIKMPAMDGLEFLAKAMKLNIESPIIMISGHGSIDTAVQAIKDGAFDFIEKPLDLNRILVTLRNAKDRNSLVAETKTLKKTVKKFKGSCFLEVMIKNGTRSDLSRPKSSPSQNKMLLMKYLKK